MKTSSNKYIPIWPGIITISLNHKRPLVHYVPFPHYLRFCLPTPCNPHLCHPYSPHRWWIPHTLKFMQWRGGGYRESPRPDPKFQSRRCNLQLTFSLCNNQTVRRSSLCQRRTGNIQIRRMLPLLHRRISSPTSRILQTLILRRQIVYTLPYFPPFFLREREITGFQKLMFLGAMK